MTAKAVRDCTLKTEYWNILIQDKNIEDKDIESKKSKQC